MALPPFTVQQVIKRGYELINKVPHPFYSQGRPTDHGPRGTSMDAPSFDCSSFIGTINGIYSCPATQSMAVAPNAYTESGYILMDYTSNLKKGDILIRNKGNQPNDGHTAMYVGNGTCIHCSSGGPAEISLGASGAWQKILRNPRGGIYIVHWNCTSHPAQSF